MEIQNSVLLLAMLFIQSCDLGTSNSNRDSIDTSTKKNEIVKPVEQYGDTLIIQWHEDSLGCKKLRSYEKASLIIANYSLKSKSLKDIINLLGDPNKKIEYNKTGTIIRYYYNTCCQEGKLNFECDYSWLDFIFSDSTAASCKIGGGKM